MRVRERKSSPIAIIAEPSSFLQIAASFDYLWPAAWDLGCTARCSTGWLYHKLQICLQVPRERSFWGDSSASCFKEGCFQGRQEQLSFWWLFGIPLWAPTARGRHPDLPWDEIAEGTRSFSGLDEVLNKGLHLFFCYPYCSTNPSPIIIFQIHPFRLSSFSLTAHWD